MDSGNENNCPSMIEIDDVTDQENLARFQLYQLLAHVFRQSPCQKTLDILSKLKIDPNQICCDMTKKLLDIKKMANKSKVEQIEKEYQLLFIGIGSGDVVPFASWYLSGSLMDKPLIILRQDLRFLGFKREEHIKEPEDHISALLEVMAMLIEENKQQEQILFFNAHIAPWFEPLCHDIQFAASAKFYSLIAIFALQFLNLEKVRFTSH